MTQYCNVLTIQQLLYNTREYVITSLFYNTDIELHEFSNFDWIDIVYDTTATIDSDIQLSIYYNVNNSEIKKAIKTVTVNEVMYNNIQTVKQTIKLSNNINSDTEYETS